MFPYQNPVLPGFYPDPSVCRVGQDYYLVTSSFEYFPGVPLFHSRDLVHWRQIGHCLSRQSQLPLDKAWASGGIYAPTLRNIQGRFYMVTTNVSQGGHFYVWADDPAGTWSEPVWVGAPGIDPSLFCDEDGSVYFTHQAEAGITQFKIDLATGKPLSQAQVILPGTGRIYPEGPHLYKIHGDYYLMWAEGGTERGHLENIARSNSPWGPFEVYPGDSILTHRNSLQPIQGTGHADLFEDQHGNWWVVFLAFRQQGYPPVYHLGRETYLAPVTWTESGWPLVNAGKPVELNMQAPLPNFVPSAELPVRDDFNSPELALSWNFLRNPVSSDYSLTERRGWLTLHGSTIDLTEPASPTWIGRRQQHFRCRAETRLDFNPQQEGEEAGLTVWMNERHHYEIAVICQDRGDEGQRRLIVRRRIGRLAAVVASQVIAAGPVRLQIQAEPGWYRFAYALGDEPFTRLPEADGETRYLAVEVGGMFTGVYFALYATGHGQPCCSLAAFDWFDYQPLQED